MSESPLGRSRPPGPPRRGRPLARPAALAAALAALASLGGCGGGFGEGEGGGGGGGSREVSARWPWPDVRLEPAPADGGKYLLRFVRDPAATDRYEVLFEREAKGDVAERERARSILFQYTTGKTPTGFDRVYWVRSEIERSYRQTKPSKSVETITRQRPPLVSPNSSTEFAGAPLPYYAVDACGHLGIREDLRQPWHYLFHDSLGYLFPLLPEAAVAVGEEWSLAVPVLVGIEARNNDFEVTFRARVKAVGRTRDGREAAWIVYGWSGSFRSERETERFRLEDVNRHREAYTVEGEGQALFDVAEGKVLRKEDSMEIVASVQDRAESQEGIGGDRTLKVAWQTHEERHTFLFRARLLGPEEKVPVEAPRRIGRPPSSAPRAPLRPPAASPPESAPEFSPPPTPTFPTELPLPEAEPSPARG